MIAEWEWTNQQTYNPFCFHFVSLHSAIIKIKINWIERRKGSEMKFILIEGMAGWAGRKMQAEREQWVI